MRASAGALTRGWMQKRLRPRVLHVLGHAVHHLVVPTQVHDPAARGAQGRVRGALKGVRAFHVRPAITGGRAEAAHSITTLAGAGMSCTISSRLAPATPVSKLCITGFPDLKRFSSECERRTDGGPMS